MLLTRVLKLVKFFTKKLVLNKFFCNRFLMNNTNNTTNFTNITNLTNFMFQINFQDDLKEQAINLTSTKVYL